MALSRNTLLIIAAAVIVVAGGIGAWFLLKSPSEQSASTAPAAVSDGKLPEPRIVILNLAAVMGASQVGQSVGQQIQTMAEQAKNDLSGEAKQLQGEAAGIAKLPESERAARAAAFAPRQDAFRQRAQQREAQVRAAFAKAQTEISKTLEPILRQVTTAHSANLVLDRRATAGLADASLDVTAEVVAQLNAKMPSYTVTLPTPQEMQALAKQMPPPQEEQPGGN
jgi:Skp family chaperone for outer membrane proteins